LDEEIRKTLIQLIEEKKPENTEQLITSAKEKLSLPEQEIIRNILQLQNEGKITLKKSSSSTSFRAYLESGAARWYWIIIIIAATTILIVCAVPENSFPLNYIRYVFGAVFVLFLPGYCFTRALFPKESQNKNDSASRIDSVARLALSFVLSMALVPLVGFLLNYTPWGVRLVPVILSLFAITGIFGTIAVFKEYQYKIKNLK